MKYLSDFFTAEFIGFVVCGVIAAAVNLGSRILFNLVIPSYLIAVILAYGMGMLTAFLLDKILIFKDSNKSTKQQAGGFIIINLLGLLQTVVFSLLFNDIIFPRVGWTLYPETLAHLIGVGIPVFTSYLGHKYISFGKRKADL